MVSIVGEGEVGGTDRRHGLSRGEVNRGMRERWRVDTHSNGV